MLGDDRRRIGRQWLGVDGTDEDRTGRGVDGRDLAERAGTQGGPQTRALQILTHQTAIEIGQLRSGIAGEGDLLVALHIDDHGLQHALLATVDGAHHAASRRRVVHPRGLLVGEQDLAELHSITDLHLHRGLHPVIVEANQRHTAYRPRGLDTLHGGAGDGQVQSTFDSYHPLSPISNN
ncbi:hypothetical protein D3C81_1559810 [compost metagenome]